MAGPHVCSLRPPWERVRASAGRRDASVLDEKFPWLNFSYSCALECIVKDHRLPAVMVLLASLLQ